MTDDARPLPTTEYPVRLMASYLEALQAVDARFGTLDRCLYSDASQSTRYQIGMSIALARARKTALSTSPTSSTCTTRAPTPEPAEVALSGSHFIMPKYSMATAMKLLQPDASAVAMPRKRTTACMRPIQPIQPEPSKKRPAEPQCNAPPAASRAKAQRLAMMRAKGTLMRAQDHRLAWQPTALVGPKVFVETTKPLLQAANPVPPPPEIVEEDFADLFFDFEHTAAPAS